ncbi:MAG: hypothetical protein DYG86_17525 [Chloroflexi bacterium CFX2]|nr:hypothetical protein [Chloroflexi bacterium CFX2]
MRGCIIRMTVPPTCRVNSRSKYTPRWIQIDMILHGICHSSVASLRVTWIVIFISLLLGACVQPEAQATGVPTEEPQIVEETPVRVIDPASEAAFLSIEENGFAHLFLFRSHDLTFARITSGDSNDITPAFNADGTKIAFASDRDGDWDLYVMALDTGEIKQVTNSLQYDSAPSWSPDGQWLAFETYQNDNLEIAVVNVDSGEIVPLTQHPASDHSPAWAPDGRHVAFISTRGGDSDVWLADLDLAGDDRYQNLSNTPFASENFPFWNRDGSQLLSLGRRRKHRHMERSRRPRARGSQRAEPNLPDLVQSSRGHSHLIDSPQRTGARHDLGKRGSSPASA